MQSVPKFVLRRLSAAQAIAESHPDAEVLAAFAEQNLADRERADVMEHISACRECRDVIAIALPEIELSTVSAVQVSNRGVFGWPVLRWGALAAGVVIVASVGVVMQLQHSDSNVALIQKSTKVPEAQPSLQQSADNPGNVAVPNHEKHNATVATKIGQGEPELTAKNIPPSFIHNHSRFQRNGPDSNSGVADKKDPGSQSTSASIPAAKIPRWTITPSGTLQRSMDAGKLWENVYPAAALDMAIDYSPDSQFVFHVVASKGLEVWAACSGSQLFASTDGGNRWSLITPSNDDVRLTGDVTRIELTDQLQRITTSTGELWVSSDDGVNWQKWH
jgi:hypothetical protein